MDTKLDADQQRWKQISWEEGQELYQSGVPLELFKQWIACRTGHWSSVEGWEFVGGFTDGWKEDYKLYVAVE